MKIEIQLDLPKRLADREVSSGRIAAQLGIREADRIHMAAAAAAAEAEAFAREGSPFKDLDKFFVQIENWSTSPVADTWAASGSFLQLVGVGIAASGVEVCRMEVGRTLAERLAAARGRHPFGAENL